MEIKIGPEAFAAYKRLDYTPWHAIAEFVDNSTQAYFSNRKKIDPVLKKRKEVFEVSIVYDAKNGVLRIRDNSSGMDADDLERAFIIGRRPQDTSGRSKYGMGLKTAACWFGDVWKIETKKLGSDEVITVIVDVTKLVKGNLKVDVKKRKVAEKETHYTNIEISSLSNELKGRTLAKIPQYIRSMYRHDLRENIVRITWQNEPLVWDGHDDNILVNTSNNKKYKKDFDFKMNKKQVRGWIGILDRGSRADAGFVIFHCGRVIDGIPTGYRPKEIFGQEGGTNNLVNQRLFGEIHLDDFDVTHTKDAIIWKGDEEEQLGEELRKVCAHFIRVAADRRKSTKDNPDERGPSDRDIQIAVDEFNAEMMSPEMIDAVRLKQVIPVAVAKKTKKQLLDRITKSTNPTWKGKIDKLFVKVYLEAMSADDPYVSSDSTNENEVVVAVNRSHPHWTQITGDTGVLNYIRHCVYDALAEWKTQQLTANIDPDTVKRFKDHYLRIPLLIEEHERQEATKGK